MRTAKPLCEVPWLRTARVAPLGPPYGASPLLLCAGSSSKTHFPCSSRRAHPRHAACERNAAVRRARRASLRSSTAGAGLLRQLAQLTRLREMCRLGHACDAANATHKVETARPSRVSSRRLLVWSVAGLEHAQPGCSFRRRGAQHFVQLSPSTTPLICLTLVSGVQPQRASSRRGAEPQASPKLPGVLDSMPACLTCADPGALRAAKFASAARVHIGTACVQPMAKAVVHRTPPPTPRTFDLQAAKERTGRRRQVRRRCVPARSRSRACSLRGIWRTPHAHHATAPSHGPAPTRIA